MGKIAYQAIADWWWDSQRDEEKDIEGNEIVCSGV